MTKAASTTSLFILSSLACEGRRRLCAYDLFHAAEHARLACEFGILESAVSGMSNIRLSDHEQQAANYYSGFLSLVKGDPAQAKKMLEGAAEHGKPYFRARALMGLAAMRLRSGDFGLASELYNESYIIASKINDKDSARWYAYKDKCILRAVMGDHKGSVRLLEEGLPAARAIGLHRPGFYLDYLNSFAVELAELNRIDEAVQVMVPVIASPLIRNFRAWRETLAELSEKQKRLSPSRAFVAVTQDTQPASPPVLDFCAYVARSKSTKKMTSAMASDRRVKMIGQLLDNYPMSGTLIRVIKKLIDDDGRKSEVISRILGMI